MAEYGNAVSSPDARTEYYHVATWIFLLSLQRYATAEASIPSSRFEPLKQASRNTTISFALVEPNSA